MAARRNLVSRARLNENSNSSPAQRRQREEEPAEPTALPSYEAPSCPLTASGRRALDELRINHNYGRYQKHLEHSKKLIPSVIGESNERLLLRRDKVAKSAERRRRQDRGDDEKTGAEFEEEKSTHKYGKRVEDLTVKAEKAMRDLIDYSDELVMQETLMTGVSETIAAAPAPRQPPERRSKQRQPRNEDSDEDAAAEEEEEEEEDQPAVPILSAAELLKKAKEDYAKEYSSKSMLQRYDNNDYGTFKRVLHESLNPGEDAPKLPKASKWFPQDSTQQESGETEESEDSDDDVYISGAKDDFKCPLSLGKFREPFTNTGCKHTYEKKTIIDFINAQGTQSSTSTKGRRQQSGKQIKCVVVGCDNILKIDDFYDDAEILRKMKRATRQAAYEMEEDDEEEQAPRGTQATRPEELDDESEPGSSRKNIAKIKNERRSRGQSSAPRRGARSSNMEMDED